MKEIQKIKELETELVKLRLTFRHIDFINDYDRTKYNSTKYKSQPDIRIAVVNYLQNQTEPIENKDLIIGLVKSMEGLAEKDFEKTGSGSIRIYSGIRSAVVKLTKAKIISIPERGHLILTEKLKNKIILNM